MRGITRETVVELVDRKMLWLFGGLTLITLFIVYLSGNIRGEIAIESSGPADLDTILGTPRYFAAAVYGRVLWLLVFLAVLGTAGLVPRMLERGRAEYYLSKPNSRAAFLASRFLAIWIVYGLLVAVCAGAVAVAGAIVHETSIGGVVFLFVVHLLIMLVWLSITVTVGLLSRSATVALMAAFSVWVAQFLLSFHDRMGGLVTSDVARTTVKLLYYVLPKTSQMAELAVNFAAGRPVETWLPLWSSLLFAGALLSAALWIFKRRDY